MPVRALGRWALLQKNVNYSGSQVLFQGPHSPKHQAARQQTETQGVSWPRHLALEKERSVSAELVADTWVLLEGLHCIQTPTSSCQGLLEEEVPGSLNLFILKCLLYLGQMVEDLFRPPQFGILHHLWMKKTNDTLFKLNQTN